MLNRFTFTCRRYFRSNVVLYLPRSTRGTQSYREFENQQEKIDIDPSRSQSFGEFDRRKEIDIDRDRSSDQSKAVSRRSNYSDDYRPESKTYNEKWRRRQEFRQALEEEAGMDEAGDKFIRQPPPQGRSTTAHFEEEDRRKRRTIANEIARRKYYDFPVEDNLLTWKAKEQIFELKRSDSELWTAERFAESFPISCEAVRRLLKRKWPPASTGADSEEEIRRHDDEVRQRWVLLKRGQTKEGLVSETTLRMIRTGQVKFLPMYAMGNTKFGDKTDDQQSNDQFSSTISPRDGPFTKLYKTHLQFLERKSSSAPEPSSKTESENNGGQALAESTKNDGDALLRSYLFPEDEPGSENVRMPYDQFRHQLTQALRRRNRPEDRKYLDWMAKNDDKQSDSDVKKA